jgi:hypothetical protein
MRRSSTLGSVQLSRSIPAAFLFCALSFAGFGCSKEGAPAGDSPVVKEEMPGSTEKAAATGAPAANQAAPADPGAAKEAAGLEGAAAKEAAAAKGDPSKAAANAKQAEGQGAAAKEAAPAADPSAAAAAPAAPAETAAAAAPADTAAPTVVSTKVGDANFSVWMQSAGKHKAGQQGVVEVVLVPKNGFKCNDNYPYKIKLSDPPAGVSYPQPVVRKESMSVSPGRSVMRVPFVASAPGDARIGGKFSFSVCTSDQCLIDSRDVSITVKVE